MAEVGEALLSSQRTRDEAGNRADMVRLSGGTFTMGSDRHYPEEAPAHPASVQPFWINRAPVTNREFRHFVEATGYVTLAETPPRPEDYPGARPDMLQAGSLVFRPPSHRVPLNDWSRWWAFRFGADWRHPSGPDSSLDGLDDHPVVHVAYPDAEAYAAWAGKALPTEAEWEFAARGGLDGAEFAWGGELRPGGRPMANIWQGEFPHLDLSPYAATRTSPVAAFPANGYGLVDMIGNVWEWTADWHASTHPTEAGSCCRPERPRRASEEASYDPAEPAIRIPRKVIKGGSHLCAPSYCRRYRPAARHPQPIDSSTSHIGFRCVVREAR